MDGSNAISITFITGIFNTSIVSLCASFRESDGATYCTGDIHRIFSFIVRFNSYTDTVPVRFIGYAISDTPGLYFCIFSQFLHCRSNWRERSIIFKKGVKE